MAVPWQAIAEAISTATQQPFTAREKRSVGGGCINSAYRVSDEERTFFVKINRVDQLPMFEAERDGLNALAKTNAVRVPQPVCTGSVAEGAFLVMENITLGRTSADTARRLGHSLARMHRAHWDRFGWKRDNTIGSTPQPNRPDSDWVEFWRQNRLGFQLELAVRNGASRQVIDLGTRLQEELNAFFTSYRPQPSLLHGDLWGGNWATDDKGDPAIFDPAVYYGDRETDLAMTELFGGFSPDFYAAYRESWPLDAGYRQRRELYNLYHILNHFNLFGGGYLSQAKGMLERLLAAIR